MNAFSSTSRNVAIVSSVIGGVVLLGVGATAAVATIGNMNSGDSGGSQSLDISGTNGAGITGLEVESNSARFELIFGDVTEATLDVSGDSRSRWDMRVDDGDLVVENKHGFFDFCIGWCGVGEQTVTLTLPKGLDTGTLDADISVNSGSLTAAGSFRDLGLDLGAGALTFDGSARSIDTEVSAGRATISVDGAQEADLNLSAGRLDAEFTGQAPKSVSLDVSAGQADVIVPRGTYDVRSDVSAGSLDNQLDTSSSARNKIEVDVSAGSAVLRLK
ncbi:MAG: DUF4097 family beta strand repeat-containing protein [Leucobacter sp.]